MAAASRRKGVAGEREAAAIFEREGLEVRGLEGSGDHLIVCRPGLTLHSEIKRQERLQLWQWLAQADEERPSGAVPVVTFKRSRSPWYSCLPTVDLAALAAYRETP